MINERTVYRVFFSSESEFTTSAWVPLPAVSWSDGSLKSAEKSIATIHRRLGGNGWTRLQPMLGSARQILANLESLRTPLLSASDDGRRKISTSSRKARW